MGPSNKRAKKFTDLVAWQKGHQLVLKIYLITKSFPKSETYSLVDQMKRASVSVTSNLAEGFNRQSKKEKIQFYYISLAPLTELQNQLLISKDVGYMNTNDFENLANLTVETCKLVNGLIRSIKRN